jgi:capsular exopolysaccharide synthesis family protein
MTMPPEPYAERGEALEPLPVRAVRAAARTAQPRAPFTTDAEDERSDILSRLRRHKYLCASVFFLTLGFMTGIYAVVPRSFSGQASVLLATPEPLLGSGDPVVEQKEGDPADLQSQVLVLVSLKLLERVAAQPAIAKLIEQECRIEKAELLARLREMLHPSHCAIYVSDKAAAAQYLQGRLDVSENGVSRVLNVSYASPIPKAGQVIPNAVVEAYIAGRLQDQLNSREVAVKWLRSEIARISTSLTKTDAEIAAFHRQHGLVQGATASLAAEQLTEINRQLTLARAARSTAAGQLAQVENGAANAPATLENQAIGLIKEHLAIVAGEAAKLASTHGPGYPELIALWRQQASLQVRLDSEVAKVAASLREVNGAASEKVASLEQQLADAKRRVAAESETETEIANLQRHAEVERELFVDLSKKVGGLEIDRRVLRGDARIISYAQYPKAPAFPRKLPFALGGLMLATIASAGAALAVDRGDRTVRTRRSLERVAGVPVLGHIPALRPAGLASCQQVMTAGPLQEAVRQLFANCVLMHGRNGPRTILVTSALPKDGKTFVALALSQFAARSGQKVLAVEADLRRPEFSRMLAVTPAANGLSEYLRGRAQFEEILVPGGISGLDIILAGKPTVDSTELISSERSAGLLSLVASRYDLVVIDSPPTEALADSYFLAKAVDGVLFCVRWGASDTRVISEALQALRRRGAQVLGLAVDQVAPGRLHLYERYKRYGIGYLPRTG